jgi:hypothetical protein
LQVLRPSERQWKPRLRQAATTLPAMADSAVHTLRKIKVEKFPFAENF